MNKTERLVSAALLAAAVAMESGCSNDGSATKSCRVVDARHHQTRIVTVDASATCPPVSAVQTSAHGAGGSAGWYFYQGAPYYGRLRKGGRPATEEEAAALERSEMQAETDAREANVRSASAARGGEGFGESGAHGEFGG